jgi:hypothetical protein
MIHFYSKYVPVILIIIIVVDFPYNLCCVDFIDIDFSIYVSIYICVRIYLFI